ncbi:hypothetical protein SAY86_032240 [Trapa natans]|uniref:Oxidoreductase-like domain-containing protein n=1 Tax=Trapa natans TaxID=22666 RepID=A0AAN7M4S0_TRANT|nr:hypothetical protein SAY86_032240 [Trapa natans]
MSAAEEKNPSIKSETERLGNNQEKEGGRKQPPRPPPPEKPLPDDCCGSGCVRCVWDIYYDDLEAYNNLYGADGSKPGPKDS